MRTSDSDIETIAEPRLAAKDPLVSNLPEIQVKGIVRGMELLKEPVEGFQGIARFRPGKRYLLHRNLSVWPHPERAKVLLVEPSPVSVCELS